MMPIRVYRDEVEENYIHWEVLPNLTFDKLSDAYHNSLQMAGRQSGEAADLIVEFVEPAAHSNNLFFHYKNMLETHLPYYRRIIFVGAPQLGRTMLELSLPTFGQQGTKIRFAKNMDEARRLLG
jgi:hypothetical protein